MTKRSSQSRARKAKAAENASASTTPPSHPAGSARMVHATRFAVIFVILAGVVFWLSTRPPPAGKVWSAEHGHWHDQNGGELP